MAHEIVFGRDGEVEVDGVIIIDARQVWEDAKRHPVLIDEVIIELHRPTPPIGRLMALPRRNPGAALAELTHTQCWGFHNPGTWPWVARCIRDAGHGDWGSLTELGTLHADIHGNVWA